MRECVEKISYFIFNPYKQLEIMCFCPKHTERKESGTNGQSVKPRETHVLSIIRKSGLQFLLGNALLLKKLTTPTHLLHPFCFCLKPWFHWNCPLNGSFCCFRVENIHLHPVPKGIDYHVVHQVLLWFWKIEIKKSYQIVCLNSRNINWLRRWQIYRNFFSLLSDPLNRTNCVALLVQLRTLKDTFTL